MQDSHTSSNSTGLRRYNGNCFRRMSFNFASSCLGKAGKSALPKGVHPRKTSSPKMEKRASLQASRPTLHTFIKCLCFLNVTSTGCNLLWSIVEGIWEAEGIQEGEVREVNGGGILEVGEVRDVGLEVGEVRDIGLKVGEVRDVGLEVGKVRDGGVAVGGSIGEGDVIAEGGVIGGVVVREETKGMEVGGVEVRVQRSLRWMDEV